MLAGTGGTTGRPKGVMLTGHNIETMTAITLMARPAPFQGRQGPQGRHQVPPAAPGPNLTG